MATKTVAPAELDGDLRIPAAAIPELRKMLAIGMAAHGELERIQGVVDFQEACGQKCPDGMRPIFPGADEQPAMSNFASALIWLDCTSPIEEPQS